MYAVMIAAPSSGQGKTTITMGLLRALQQRGLDLCAYKVGPDYIDPAFLSLACGKPARNLDLHLQGEAGVQYSIARAPGHYAVVEGVMGYFDGIANTPQNSSCHLADLLDIPTVLIYTPKGEMFSAIPKIKGMADFPRSRIRAVLFNRVSPRYYHLLKAAVEQYTDLAVPGFLPPMPEYALESRHLGLVQSIEVADLEQKIEAVAETIAAHVDLDVLIRLMRPCRTADAAELPPLRQRPITVAIARDEAFSFYYTENLELLEQCCQVIYFSPLRESELPPCDFLYLGGGYPQVFHAELSLNTAMQTSIRAYIERGGCVYAECGGFMYLTEAVDDGPMVGIFKGRTRLTSRLQRFGYIDIKITRDCLLGKTGDHLTGHEFHRSISDVQGDTAFAISKTMGATTWVCGYMYKNVLAGYPHISFFGHLKQFEHLLEYVEQHSRCTDLHPC